MSSTMYFLRRKSMKQIEQDVTEKFNVELCYKNNKERVFKSQDLLITCRSKYILVLVYDNAQENQVRSISNSIF